MAAARAWHGARQFVEVAEEGSMVKPTHVPTRHLIMHQLTTLITCYYVLISPFGRDYLIPGRKGNRDNDRYKIKNNVLF